VTFQSEPLVGLHGPSSSARVRPVTQASVLRAEWIKLRSLRSTVLVLGLTVLFMAVGLIASYFDEAHWSNPDAAELISHNLIGVNLAQLTVGALGVLVITGEYATGMIRATLVAVPRRLPVLWAKVAVFAAMTFLTCLASALVTFLGGQDILGSHGVSLGGPGALRAVFGVTLYVTVVGVFGVGLGFLVRSTAGGITALFAILLVVPEIAKALPSTWQPHVVPYLPSSAGQALYAAHPNAFILPPWSGFALFFGYAAVAVVAAAVSLCHRDA
jgi:ABC-2 type transport system permease protein